MLRLKSVFAVSTAVLLSLTACSSAPTPEPSGSAVPSASASPTAEAIKPANNLDGIEVKGDAGKAPEVKVPSPWAIDETRVKVLSEGKGAELSADGVAVVHYFGVNGRTGEKFDESFSKGEPVAFPLNRVVPGFSKGLAGQKIGSRVLIAMPGSDGYDAGGGNLQAGIRVGDTLVFVVDIANGSLVAPNGAEQQLPAGAPSVTVKDGKPEVAIPSGAEPPAKVQLNYLVKGTGAALKAEDVIGVKYVAYSWKTGKQVHDGTKALDQGALSKTIDGWKTGLVGVPLGSRVQLIVPNAYPQGANNPPVEAGDTLVYVIDVLYVQ